ncbi:cysteine-rich motor neuron 1 protein-like [Stylophora pistillata]|uniref:cysteine-rich motor neuron 1 protein-like n=1 Tax=Stylophora pistillata TaxID=50429 RepID=UPI000C041C20|nr:cysteine-rich motor neuron 1 protein-like [Stylophora pistillata]
MTRDGGILMKHQSWNYKGCELFFNGTDLDGSEVCPPMARPECYVYSGTICCASKCAALQEIAKMLRGHLTVCSNGHQLVSNGLCRKKTPGCLRDPSRNSCSSEVSCQDEKSNQYFEGVTWSVGNCIQCSCRAGKIHCKREISVINSLEEESLTEYCIQNECDVFRFLAKNRGKCKACRWNGTIYYDGDSWKENDIHFFCSTYNQILRAGCCVEQRRVNCVHTSNSGQRDVSVDVMRT